MAPSSFFALCFASVLLLFPTLTTPHPTEFQSLRSSRLWNDNEMAPISEHCRWPGIKCNINGFIVKINRQRRTLEGTIPREVFQLAILQVLDLSSNRFEGQIQPEIEELANLTSLNLLHNNLSGAIPLQITQLSALTCIDLSSNSIDGSIPSVRRNPLYAPSYLNLSHNNISGIIPESLSSFDKIDLSYNNLEGCIPSAISSEFLLPNNKLVNCQEDSSWPFNPTKERKRHNYVPIVAPLAVFFVLSIIGRCWFLLKHKVIKVKSKPPVTIDTDVLKIWNFNGKIAYEDLVEATEDFDLSYCVGRGGYGSVYKAPPKHPNSTTPIALIKTSIQ